MRVKLLFIILMIALSHSAFPQFVYRQQYFDGADTLCNFANDRGSICIRIDDDSMNIWQIGIPQKTLFGSAATLPNALVTDTANFYPPNNSSGFQFSIPKHPMPGILAIRWKQKLDMDTGLDGGRIEYSINSGTTWQNVFNNPYVYNYYGYDTSNIAVSPGGDYVFTGTDTVWRDVWLCYHTSWIQSDSILFRFTFTSDSIDNSKEGWMIDNFICHYTISHTLKGIKSEKYLNVYPNPANDYIHIEAQSTLEHHLIERMVLVNSFGQIVNEWSNLPPKFYFDIKNYSNGLYYLRIKTNIKQETIPIFINHN